MQNKKKSWWTILPAEKKTDQNWKKILVQTKNREKSYIFSYFFR